MIFVAYTIHVVVCLFLILVVLLQQGKGADLSVFGGGGTQAAFGARGATTLLHKLTVWGFVGFILTTIAIGFLQTAGSQSSVIPSGPAAESTAPATEAEAAPAAADDGTAASAEGAVALEGAAPGAAPTAPATPEGDDAPAGGGTTDAAPAAATGPPAGQ